jgi:TRAP-type mannitol/chloroaromatic compound transport system permease small subunit
VQWYLFSIFLFCAGYTLKNRARAHRHHHRLLTRARAPASTSSELFFLFPMAFIIMWLSWPVFVETIAT